MELWFIICYQTPLNNRITESLTLEKTSKIMKSNCHPKTTMSAKPCPDVPHLHVFWTPPRWQRVAASEGSVDLVISAAEPVKNLQLQAEVL